MKYIYVCSPLRGDYEKNTGKAREYCRWVCDNVEDAIPIAPHIYFPQFFKDAVLEERLACMEMALELLGLCDAIYVFGDYASEGMKQEIEQASEWQKPIRYVSSEAVGDEA